MEIRDRSGEPRTKEEIVEAIMATERATVRDIMNIPPYLGVHLGTIRDALIELLGRREKDDA
jgi:hypothetical protein